MDWPDRRELAVWPYWVTGCNLLFHRQTALDIGLFRTNLGRRGRWMGDRQARDTGRRGRDPHWPASPGAGHVTSPVIQVNGGAERGH